MNVSEIYSKPDLHAVLRKMESFQLLEILCGRKKDLTRTAKSYDTRPKQMKIAIKDEILRRSRETTSELEILKRQNPIRLGGDDVVIGRRIVRSMSDVITRQMKLHPEDFKCPRYRHDSSEDDSDDSDDSFIDPQPVETIAPICLPVDFGRQAQ